MLTSKPITDVAQLEKLYGKNITDVVEDIRVWHGDLIHPAIKCYVIGNGTSRRDKNLNDIVKSYQNAKSFSIGCNYIYKEYTPNVIVAQDTKVLLDIAKDKVTAPVIAPLLKYNWLLQNNLSIENFYALRFPTYAMTRWKTGELALYVACLLGFKNITAVAFDGGGSNVHRKDDGVSFIDIAATIERIRLLKDSFVNVNINNYEDNL
jgi:hypothetical protein